MAELSSEEEELVSDKARGLVQTDEFSSDKTFSVQCVYCVPNSVREAKSYENKDFRDLDMSETPLFTIQSRSRIDCAKKCQREELCLSFLFNDLTKLCSLFNMDIPTSSGRNNPGNKFYYMTKDCTLNEAVCPVNLGYHFSRELCFCYKVYTTKQNYDNSVILCENDNGELAKINRELRQKELENALNGISSYAETYIQGTRTSSSTTWYYNDGTEVTYFNWNTPGGQPQLRSNGENYLLVRKTQGYRWHDVYKAEKHGVVCEI